MLGVVLAGILTLICVARRIPDVSGAVRGNSVGQIRGLNVTGAPGG